MSALQREEMRSKGIAAIRAAATEGSKLEKFFEKKLIEAGFRVQLHKLLIPSENLEIDLYIPGLQTIIEVDGPSHFLPIWGQDKLDKQINADLRKTGTLLTKGYVVIRVKSMGQESVAKREQMADTVINILSKIKNKKPNRKNCFIEVE
jgi:very-short-patch-repair endonuclease